MKPYQLENYRIIKDEVRTDTWCTVHLNCFKASFGPGESEKHMDKKYERWKYWQKKGFYVFTEVRLKNGQRPDLIVFNENEIFIEEIVNTEKKESIEKKKYKYPFSVFVIEVEK